MRLSFQRFFLSSLFAWFLVTIVGVYFLIHVRSYIRFGIDLAGGTYITLEIDTEKAFQDEIVSVSQSLIEKTTQAALPAPSFVYKDGVGMLSFATQQDAHAAEGLVREELSQCNLTVNDTVLNITLTQAAKAAIQKNALESNIQVLHTRLDEYSVAEISIAAQGDKQIVVEIPQEDDVQRAKARIGKAALLEIKPVIYDEDSGRASFHSQEALLENYGGVLPESTVIASDRTQREFYLVPAYAEITGRLLKEVKVETQAGRLGNELGVSIEFNKEGSEKFARLTRSFIGKQAAILIDGVVISAPQINEPIENGRAVISGSFREIETVKELALMLKSGAFVAPLKFEEERTVGPSLGKEAIASGLRSCWIGLALLFVFSLLFYKTAGIFAVIVLVYNLLLILFMLAALGGTLTLPGIAGMVLTVGMAIDASILIYERIKEELALGRSMRQAVDIGFSGASSIILDANLTHFLVAVVLYLFGAGPIKGFAVTMIIGIISTLITGLMLLKSLFNFALDTLGLQKIKI
jgi:preprotein translocase subunit SecD